MHSVKLFYAHELPDLPLGQRSFNLTTNTRYDPCMLRIILKTSLRTIYTRRQNHFFYNNRHIGGVNPFKKYYYVLSSVVDPDPNWIHTGANRIN